MKLDIASLIESAQKMQLNLENTKNELSNKLITSSSGAGMVTATVNGNSELIKLDISDELMSMNDKEMLQDLVIGAINNAIKQAQDLLNEEMKKMTGGLPNIPGFNFNI